jgi:hypothetical protein
MPDLTAFIRNLTVSDIGAVRALQGHVADHVVETWFEARSVSAYFCRPEVIRAASPDDLRRLRTVEAHVGLAQVALATARETAHV